MTTRAGVVVAGGRSRRFGGSEKALAEFDGDPLLRRTADRVSAVVDELVVNCRAGQVDPFRRALTDASYDPRFAVDAVPDRGPVAGMATGLRAADEPVAVVTACDMPTLDPAFLASLFADARGATGAVPTFDGRRQPLAAVYRVEPTVEACVAALDSEADAGFGGVLDRLDPVVVPEATVRERTDGATFRNVNARSDLRTDEASLR
ncbi:molybdenum cofactor guanylyltransferase [Halorussus rarus]|uniref:molybdenum cofactor guanylyltransferase n=1 Tax=Halorussus TaxID=1070314 RepID=UPI000E20F206|nr:molybdenum cofactor guanylyltransferase [Halorussus rarus]NHN58357.1 molybdenum cofactor guanylyltransferase [Halorussus sp. JP-T4]